MFFVYLQISKSDQYFWFFSNYEYYLKDNSGQNDQFIKNTKQNYKGQNIENCYKHLDFYGNNFKNTNCTNYNTKEMPRKNVYEGY